MFEPYPGGSPAAPPPQVQQQPERPGTVRAAVLLMYVGAALNALAIILILVALGGLRTAIQTRFPGYSASRVHTLEVAAIVPQVIAVGLWLWMAWANGRGRRWARIVSAVLFGLWTVYLLSAFARPHAGAGLLAVCLIWLVGLAATVLIFLRQSAPFYQQQQ